LEEAMNETEWLACDDPLEMLDFLRGRVSERQLRLFGCACCRRIWHLLIDAASQQAVEFTEQYADGLFSAEELYIICEVAHAAEEGLGSKQHLYAASAATCISADHVDEVGTIWSSAAAVGEAAADGVPTPQREAVREDADQAERIQQCYLLRDIVGNPFRSVLNVTSWRTPEVENLALDLDRTRAFERMPELARALAAAGCAQPEILNHCISPGPHVKGCWVIELLTSPGEKEWRALPNTKAKLQHLRLRGKASDRQLRLFGVACCRRVWVLFRDEAARGAVEIAEQFADNLVSSHQRQEAEDALDHLFQGYRAQHGYFIERAFHQTVAAELAALYVVGTNPVFAANQALGIASASAWSDANLVSSETTAEEGLLRDIFGDPWRCCMVDPAWLSWNEGYAVKLAQAIYDDRSFNRLPALANALEQAGCTDPVILEHCRDPGPHVRGCWILDLLLSKQ
jgi:hypothetical protein